MARKFKLILIFLFVGFTTLQSQTVDQNLLNLKKYWWYHHRLLNDFMAKGDCQGCSEVMSERSDGATQGCPSTSSLAKWGDQTDDLGDLMGVLATEYKLEVINGQPTDSTLEELYYVLRAFNRLDQTAEFNLPFPLHPTNSSDLNGFFIRDDVPSNFLTLHPKLKNGLTSIYPVSSLESDFTDSRPRTKQMSSDHAWHIMMGCALIRKCLTDGINYKNLPLNNANGNTNMWDEAFQISDRIVMRMKHDSWIIKDPNSGDAVDRGAVVVEESYGVAEAAGYIKTVNESYISFSDEPFKPKHRRDEYHDEITYLNAPFWNDLGKPSGSSMEYGVLLHTGSTTDFFKPLFISAIGNSWWDHQAIVESPIEITVELSEDPLYYLLHPGAVLTLIESVIVPMPPSNLTQSELGTESMQYSGEATGRYSYEFLPLLRQVLHGGGNSLSNSVYINVLNSAPCNGPYDFGYDIGCSASFDWSTHNRLRAPDNRGERRFWYTLPLPDGDQYLGEHGYGEYPGVDYMLYYNLYTLEKYTEGFSGAGAGIAYVDWMDRQVTFPFPTTSSPITGTTASPAEIDAYNVIAASNIVNSDGVVTYRAGKEITLLPGFDAIAGADFDAYIDPFHCASDNNYRSSVTSNDTSDQSPSNNLIAYAGPTTFINYPASYTQTTNSVAEYHNTSNRSIAPAIPSTVAQPLTTPKQPVSGITISPNPNAGSFQIVVLHNNQSIGIKELKVMSMMGTVIWSIGASANNVFNVDISTFSPGIYYVQCINESGEIETKKLIKQ